MDKQKQIEEMARDICGNFGVAIENKCGPLNFQCDCKCKWFDIAERFYNAGYRKIPEGAVVLMGMETEQQFEDLMVAFDEMGFMPYTTHPFPEEYVETWKQRLIFVFGQLRKETAEKFARLVEFHSVSTRDEEGREIFTISALGLKEILHEEFGVPYDEICKEITEGKNE